LEWTDWTVVQEEDNDVDGISDKISSFIHFSVETVIPCKTMTCFPNNKPWVTSEVKAAISRKEGSLSQ